LFGAGSPDLVVRLRDAAGVAAALRYAADAGLAVTVRSGGHSMAGLSTSMDGMIIDTRRISGVGGLTLGGGIGWMVRQRGLLSDSLAAVQLVTADGRLIGADAVEHADLFWALRGGGNFGAAADGELARPDVG
jgi:FAD/FMN-containing dehydrogenase